MVLSVVGHFPREMGWGRQIGNDCGAVLIYMKGKENGNGGYI
jgi:hypothetical protein